MRLLLVTLDCLSRRWLGCYGGHDLPTPGFDALSTYGTTFDGCIAADVTSKSPQVAGVRIEAGADGKVIRLKDVEEPLPVRLMDVRKAEKKSDRAIGSKMLQLLDQGMVGLEDAECVWVRHAGFSVSSGPRMSVDEVEQVAEQLVELDCTVGMFFDRWREFAASDWRLLVVGLSGLIQPHAADDPPALCDDWIHLPAWQVDGSGERFGRRDSELRANLIEETLRNCLLPTAPAASVEPRDHITIRGPGQRAIRSRDWFLRLAEGDEPELFRKPEDVWDVRDVALQRPEVTEQLVARLKGESGRTEH